MKTTVGRRGIKGGKRLDTNQWKDLLAKGNLVTSLGVVRKFPGQTSHFELSTENGSLEVLVDVELIPSSTRVLCRLGFGSAGVYSIPRVDQEVAVMLPFDPQSLIKDPLDFEPIIVGVLDLETPSELTDENVVVVKANHVKVLSDDIVLGDDSANALALKSDVEDLATYVDTQLVLAVSVAGPLTGTATVATTVAPSATGTTKVKGK